VTSIKTLLAAKTLAVVLATTAVIALATPAAAETLRLLTWGGYAPDAIVKKFRAGNRHHRRGDGVQQ